MANVGASLKDASGDLLGTAATLNFSTSAETWNTNLHSIGTPQTLATSAPPVVTSDSAGNVYVAWIDTTGGVPDQVYAARYDITQGAWGLTQDQLSTSGQLQSLELAPDGSGNVFMVVTETNGTLGLAVFLEEYSAASQQWLPEGTIPAVPNSLYSGKTAIAVSPSGVVNLLTLSFDGVVNRAYVVQGNSINASPSYTSPLEIDALGPTATGSMDQPSLVVDAAGDVTAAWLSAIGTTTYSLQTSRLASGSSSWTPPVQIDASPSGPGLHQYVLSSNSSGQMVAVWSESTMVGGPFTVSASAFNPTTSAWSTPVVLDDSTASAQGANNVSVVVDAAGFATAMWQRPGAAYLAARYNFATGAWSSPVVAYNSGGTANAPLATPALTADIAGNVVAIVNVSGVGSPSSMVNQALTFSASSNNWSTPTLIDLQAGGTSGTDQAPGSAVDASGNVTAAWFEQGSGGPNLATNRLR